MTQSSIGRLNREWERIKLKYGIAESVPELERLFVKTRRRQARLRHAATQLKAFQGEVTALENEIEGLESTVRLLLHDCIERAHLEHGPSWSPTAMLGFRAWLLTDGRLHGYRQPWPHSSMKAQCGTTSNQEDLPHTGGECRLPPCGIYAAKDLRELMVSHPPRDEQSIAFGLVGLTGKVVEHERGWRAEEVTVLALAYVRGDDLYTSNDPDELEFLFQGIGLGGPEDPPPKHFPATAQIRADTIQYLESQLKEQTQWILGNQNES